MKRLIKYSGLLIALGICAVSAYAFDAALEQAPAKTFADFQKEYSGTKPVVAWMKYHDYLSLQKMPRPTLEPSRIRMETTLPYDEGLSGTKDIVKFTRPSNWNSEGLERYVDKSRPFLNPDPAPGTKAVVAFTRSSR